MSAVSRFAKKYITWTKRIQRELLMLLDADSDPITQEQLNTYDNNAKCMIELTFPETPTTKVKELWGQYITAMTERARFQLDATWGT
jgi:hypothetical protein